MEAKAYIKEYSEKMICIQEFLLEFLENDKMEETDFIFLINNLDNAKIRKNKHEFKSLLHMIAKISNHRRNQFFNNKIDKILKEFQKEITQNFSNTEIFNIFISNKRILLFLFEEKIIVPDQTILSIMTKKKYFPQFYFQYFYNEMKEFFNEQTVNEMNLSSVTFSDNYMINESKSDLFQINRKTGENENYICQLIRNDSLDEFISYTNKATFNLSSNVNESIFETNLFLLGKKPTLIEYSAFFGSIQIYRYLKLNGVELTPSLWLYAIHGNNPEMIHLLEEDHVEMEDKSVTRYVIELMKCHHNELTNYFFNIYNHNNKGNDLDVTRQIFKYYNFIPFSEKFTQSLDTLYDICVSDISKSFNEQFNVFYILCQYDYFAIVDFLLKNSSFELEPYNIYENYLFLNRI